MKRDERYARERKIKREKERERVRKIRNAVDGKEAGRRWRWRLPSFVDREIERAAVQR